VGQLKSTVYHLSGTKDYDTTNARRNTYDRDTAASGMRAARIKKQEELEQFVRFRAVYGTAVYDQILKQLGKRRQPEWRPSWIEGVRYQAEVTKILREKFTRPAASRPQRTSNLSKQFNENVAEKAYPANRGDQCEG